jgi:hypothetical protein
MDPKNVVAFHRSIILSQYDGEQDNSGLTEGQLRYNKTHHQFEGYHGQHYGGWRAFHLDIASASQLGGIKLGHNLHISHDGTLSSTAAGISQLPQRIITIGSTGDYPTLSAADDIIQQITATMDDDDAHDIMTTYLTVQFINTIHVLTSNITVLPNLYVVGPALIQSSTQQQQQTLTLTYRIHLSTLILNNIIVLCSDSSCQDIQMEHIVFKNCQIILNTTQRILFSNCTFTNCTFSCSDSRNVTWQYCTWISHNSSGSSDTPAHSFSICNTTEFAMNYCTFTIHAKCMASATDAVEAEAVAACVINVTNSAITCTFSSFQVHNNVAENASIFHVISHATTKLGYWKNDGCRSEYGHELWKCNIISSPDILYHINTSGGYGGTQSPTTVPCGVYTINDIITVFSVFSAYPIDNETNKTTTKLVITNIFTLETYNITLDNISTITELYTIKLNNCYFSTDNIVSTPPCQSLLYPNVLVCMNKHQFVIPNILTCIHSMHTATAISTNVNISDLAEYFKFLSFLCSSESSNSSVTTAIQLRHNAGANALTLTELPDNIILTHNLKYPITVRNALNINSNCKFKYICWDSHNSDVAPSFNIYQQSSVIFKSCEFHGQTQFKLQMSSAIVFKNCIFKCDGLDNGWLFDISESDVCFINCRFNITAAVSLVIFNINNDSTVVCDNMHISAATSESSDITVFELGRLCGMPSALTIKAPLYTKLRCSGGGNAEITIKLDDSKIG